MKKNHGYCPDYNDGDDVVRRLMFSDEVSSREKCSYRTISYIAVLVIVTMTTSCVIMPLILTVIGRGIYQLQTPVKPYTDNLPCEDSCSITIVESIPENLTYPSGAPSQLSTFDAWSRLIDAANSSIDIASFYWTLLGDDVIQDPSDWQGEAIYKKLLSAVQDRKIQLRIVQNLPSKESPDKDTVDLAKAGAQVRSMNFTALLGAGILHTKFWIVDQAYLYTGSANMDWRSLTQVKELGAMLGPCPCLARDASKLFEVYWYLAQPGAKVPDHWPQNVSTVFNSTSPMQVQLNSTASSVYLASSPPQFCPDGRTGDINAILSVIQRAQKYIFIAVMDYAPALIFARPKIFWPIIDDALKSAAINRKVKVYVLASLWNHTAPALHKYLRSLAALNGALGAKIETRLFRVPVYSEAQAKIPYSRVNHNKYMVTDNAAYIGTSNWSGDYFVNTGGIGLVVNQTESGHTVDTVQQQLTAIFIRDWNSTYATPVAFD